MRKYILLGVWVCIGCNNSGMVLKRADLSGYDSIHILEQYPDKGIQIVDLINFGHLGNFSMQPAIIKKNNGSARIVYLMDNRKDNWMCLSKEFVAFTKPNTENWGWFQIKGGVIIDQLPRIQELLDSLKSKRNDVSGIESNGYISVVKDGKSIEPINYGSIISLKLKDVAFDSLRFGLYQMIGDTITEISREPNDIHAQKDGLFFVPPPGFDVISKFSKSIILEKIDSVSRLSNAPTRIYFKPN